MTNNYVDEFKTAMIEAGIFTDSPILATGKIERAHQVGDKSCSKNIAYCLHLDSSPAGYFENFKLGVKAFWKASGKRLSKSDFLKIEQAKALSLQESLERQQKSAKTANYLWQQAERLTLQTHPYLIKKHVQPYGLRINDAGALLVPIFCCGRIVSLQFIHADGSKRFLSGGKLKGCFAKVGLYQENQPILICEGFSTAASLHQHSGYLTLAAMSAANLVEVALLVRQKRPDANILICADNDLNQVGQQAAERAASAIDAQVVTPPTSGFDWNDEINHGGIFTWKI